MRVLTPEARRPGYNRSMRFIVLLLLLAGTTLAKPRVVDVAVVADGPWSGNDRVFELFREETLALTRGEFEVRFPEAMRRTADWSGDGVRAALDAALADPEVEVVLALGILASHFAGHTDPLPKPVIAPFVIDAEMQQFPQAGRRNLAYITERLDFARELEVFREVVHYKKLACLGNRNFIDAVPQLALSIAGVLSAQESVVALVVVGDDLDAALKAIPEDADAVYVAPMLHLSDADFARLTQHFIDRGLPSFSVIGRYEVERGLMMGLRPAEDMPLKARRVALAIQQILLGEPAKDQPTAFATREQLTINMATARAVKAWPSWRVLTEAELLHTEQADPDRKLTLVSAVREALEVSADLAVRDAEVRSGAEEIPKARANLLPSLDAAAQGTWIDDDRAAASLGSQPEWTGTVKGTLTQVLWSQGAWANLDAQRHLQRGRRHGVEAARLDVALDASIAYLNVLQARTFERIQRDNLKLTRRNLDASRIRQRIGSAGASEVHRWEAQIATDTQEVIAAETQHRVARIGLNRLLRRPQEEPFAAEETALDDPDMVSSQKVVFQLLDNPWTFRIFRGFMVTEGIRNAPEVAQLDAALDAARTRIEAARRALWSPTLALSGEVSYRFFEGGEGTDGLSLPAGVDAPPTADDLNYGVGLVASIPLYAGGGRYAEIRQAEAEQLKLQRQREAAVEAIEQRVRAAVQGAGASFPNIRLSRDAAAAARKNLALVGEAYARGATSIIQLLDAQNAARTADQLAANAVYRFLADLCQVHRAVGGFYFLQTPVERAAWIARFVAYMGDNGAVPKGDR